MPLLTRDPESEYGAIEPLELHKLATTINDFQAALFTKLQAGKRVLWVLTAATMPATVRCQCTGQISIAAGASHRIACQIPHRVTSVEIFNYDSSNALTLSLDGPTGGTMGTPIYVAAGTYYTKDINIPSSDLAATVYNGAGAAVLCQVLFNGF